MTGERHADAIYRDTGCEVSPSCLRCPLEVCRFESGLSLHQLMAQQRAKEIRRRRAAGEGIDDIARALGVTRRTVFRALARRDAQ